MRILVLSKSFPTGDRPAYGADLMCRRVVEHLAASGHEVAVLTSRSMAPAAGEGLVVCPRLVKDRPDPDLLPDQWSARHKLQFLRKARHNYAATRRALRIFRPDVVYVSDLELLTGSPLGALQEAGAPLVFHAHDLTLLRTVGGQAAADAARGAKQALLDWFLRPPRGGRSAKSRPLLAVSEFIAEQYRGAGWETDQVRIVYNGVDERHFAGGPREKPESNSLLLAGRCVPDKGLHLAVEAVGRLAQRGIEAELHLVGEFQREAYRTRLQELAAQWGVTERVVYRGYVSPEDMPAEYRRHAGAVVPSLGPEAFGLVSVEAQANGTPVVVAATGGLPETLAAGSTGLVVPPDDAAALAGAIEQLLADGDTWRRMSAAGQAFARDRFGMGRMVSAVESCLVETARRGGG